MPTYKAPGVYVEEVSTGARPIMAVGTSTAAFFGKAPSDAHLREPRRITNWTAFRREFVSEEDEDGAMGNTLAAAVAGFFLNGGTVLFVINLGEEGDQITANDLGLIAAVDGISLVAAPGYTDADSIGAILDDCEKRRDRFAVLDAERTVDQITDWAKLQAKGGARPRTSDMGAGAVYVPWITVTDPLGKDRMTVPPSGHLCGAYAQTDGTRGVHKAPANLVLRGVSNVDRALSQADQADLNPHGVNCIRSFDSGIRVWGARTLAPETSEYRYVPVRRLVTMISQSIQRGTEWVVFEPNDLTLWKSLRRDIGSFLHLLWQDGALMGATPEEAYFVKCDIETTTQAHIDRGEVVAVIGIAPVKPAEFVIIQIGQTTAGVPD